MRKFYLLLLSCCFIALLAFDYSSAVDDSRVLASPITGLDVQDPAKLNLNNDLNNKSDPVVDGDKHHLNKPKDGLRNDMDKTDSSTALGFNDGHNVSTEKEKEKSKGGLIVKKSDKNEKVNEELKSKAKPKDGDKEELPLIKENSPPHEECGASNGCNDEENHLVACLRVPGNESPELSLLIQNKGDVTLTVRISAPDYVDLETRKVKLPQKENKKVKVSIKHRGTNTMIVLKSGGKNCNIDFKDVVALNSEKESSTTPNSKYAIILNYAPYIAILLVLILLVGSAFLCVRIKHRHFPTGDTKYQKLNMELPVAGGGGVGSKPDSDVSDGWDNGWDDNWDDEEAPKAPSLPVTPSLSSKGLAPRRSNKEAWKD